MCINVYKNNIAGLYVLCGNMLDFLFRQFR